MCQSPTNADGRFVSPRSGLARHGLMVSAAALMVGAFVLASPGIASAEGKPMPGGTLEALLKGGQKKGFPLKHTDVEVDVSGFVSRVKVTQVFKNPFKERLEAIYTFPLSDRGAVDGMVMRIGSRQIRAEIHEREEARQIYEEARDNGQHTALLEQERPNIFTQSVANIKPGEEIRIELTYIDNIKLTDDEYEFVFPMVVGPRYIPGQPVSVTGHGMVADTDRVPDASKITPPMLPKGTRSGHDISLKARIAPGIKVGEFYSPSHGIDISSKGKVTYVSLQPGDSIPNKDFVLRYKPNATKVGADVLTHKKPGSDDGYFTMLVQPPKDVASNQITPRELVFVVDTSGSMMGEPLTKVKEAMFLSLENMHPKDTFRILRFSDTVSGLSTKALPNTKANRDKAHAYMSSLQSGGGTDMLQGIKAALDAPDPGQGRMRVVFFMTDGYIGNDTEIIEMTKNLVGDSRLFSFGIGSGVNRFLLNRMGTVGRGDAFFVRQDESPREFVERFYKRIAKPVLTDISIDWDGLAVDDVGPEPVRDLFAGQTLELTGRYTKAGAGTIRVNGKIGGRKVTIPVKVSLPDKAPKNSGLPALWARRQIEELKNEFPYEVPDEVKESITALGLQFSLITEYTSFVAVEEKIVVDPNDPSRTMAVPVETPEGVESEMTPNQVQPGDPIIRVKAPKNTVSVRVLFEFGLEKNLELMDSGEWETRFLVPAFVKEGEYRVDVLVEEAGGKVTHLQLPYRVDEKGPELELLANVEEVAEHMGLWTLRVKVDDPEVLAAVHEHDVAVEILPDSVKTVRAKLPDGRIVTLKRHHKRPGQFYFHYKVRVEPGEYKVPIEAVDAAENSTIIWTTLTVVEPQPEL